MVIPARPIPVIPRPPHVNGLYMHALCASSPSFQKREVLPVLCCGREQQNRQT
jgi:hypothetical protein